VASFKLAESLIRLQCWLRVSWAGCGRAGQRPASAAPTRGGGARLVQVPVDSEPETCLLDLISADIGPDRLTANMIAKISKAIFVVVNLFLSFE
jgi:hypothetical protein